MSRAQDRLFEFSANTAYLWTELPFLDRIRKAAQHGFDAVEFHDEARCVDRGQLRDVLAEAALPVSGLNVRMGATFGCAAIPGAGEQARRDVDEAVEIAEDIGAAAIHVLAGLASGPGAQATYLQTLRYALDQAGCIILIEPVCTEQLPGYFLNTIDQAAAVIAEIGHPRLRIMFDCYHVFRQSGDLAAHFAAHADQIGHVQIAAAEGRAEPLAGAIDYGLLLPTMQACGYAGRFGCEYRPTATTAEGLWWRDVLAVRAIRARNRAVVPPARRPGV